MSKNQKKIQFKKLDQTRNLVLLVLAFLLIVIGAIGIFTEKNTIITKTSMLIGNLIMLIYYIRMFSYKNYVHWNKFGMRININESWLNGKNIKFKEVKAFEIKDNVLDVDKHSSQKVTINLKGIEQKDIERLRLIFKEHIVN